MVEFLDPVHGQIELPREIALIMHCDAFKRLKCVRQLGFMKLGNGLLSKEVIHSRYYHCIGTYYLANKALEALEANTEWIKFEEPNGMLPFEYRSAILVAALMHDAGHGAFSHTWEYIDHKYHHEDFSCLVLDDIFARYPTIFPELRINHKFGLDLSKALIRGERDKFKHKFPAKYNFIFEIVNNKYSGVDVDKWDYLLRDYFYLKRIIRSYMNINKTFTNAVVSKCGQHIIYSTSDITALYRWRWLFHVNCYRTVRNAICDTILQMIVCRSEYCAKFRKIRLNNFDIKLYVEFVDANVISCIQGDPLCKFLDERVEFKELSANDLQKQTGVAVIRVQSVTEALREFTFPDDGPHTFRDDSYPMRKLIRFYCDGIESIVYYSVDHLPI